MLYGISQNFNTTYLIVMHIIFTFQYKAFTYNLTPPLQNTHLMLYIVSQNLYLMMYIKSKNSNTKRISWYIYHLIISTLYIYIHTHIHIHIHIYIHIYIYIYLFINFNIHSMHTLYQNLNYKSIYFTTLIES